MGISVDVVVISNDSLSGTATRDGVTLTAGVTRILAVDQNTPADNGPWLAQTAGWTRPTDYSVDADYVVGQYLFVQSGASGAGSNWQLTSGSTVLGAKTYQRCAAVVDLSESPYFVQDWPSWSAWANAGKIDYGQVISNAYEDYRGQPVRFKLPVSNGGVIGLDTPIFRDTEVGVTTGGPTLDGSGTAELHCERSGGHCLVFANPGSLPAVSGTALDAAVAATPLQMVSNSTVYFFNLRHAGVYVDGWSGFEIRTFWRLKSNLGAPTHIASCRGSLPGMSPATVCWSLFYDNVYTRLAAVVRTKDTTKGVYGAVTPGSGNTSTSAVTGDATVTPTNDCTFGLRVANGGTIGSTGITIEYTTNADNADPTWEKPIALGTATSLTLGSENSWGLAVLDNGEDVTAKFNFGAGTLVKGDTWIIHATGVHQTVTLSTAIGSVALNTAYVISLQYNPAHVGSEVRLYLNQPGVACVTPITGTATGLVEQYPWEDTIYGYGVNGGFIESVQDFSTPDSEFGSIRFLSSNIADPPATTETTIPQNATGQKFCWVPGPATPGFTGTGYCTGQLFRQDGVTPRAWVALTEIGRDVAFITARTLVMPQLADGGLEGLTIRTGADASQRMSGLLSVGWRSRYFNRLKFNCAEDCWNNIGPDFFSNDIALDFVGSRRRQITIVQASVTMLNWTQDTAGLLGFCADTVGIVQHGTWFINTEDGCRHPVVMGRLENALIDGVVIDDENQANHAIGREWFRMTLNDGGASISGGLGSGSCKYIPFKVVAIAGPVSAKARLFLDKLSTNCKDGTPCLVAVDETFGTVATIEGGAALNEHTTFSSFPRISNKAGRFRFYGGTLPALGSLDAAETYPIGGQDRIVILNSQTSARTKTIDPTGFGVFESNTLSVLHLPQGNAVTYVNGGPSGGNILVMPASASCVLKFRKNFAGDAELAV